MRTRRSGCCARRWRAAAGAGTSRRRRSTCARSPTARSRRSAPSIACGAPREHPRSTCSGSAPPRGCSPGRTSPRSRWRTRRRRRCSRRCRRARSATTCARTGRDAAAYPGDATTPADARPPAPSLHLPPTLTSLLRAAVNRDDDTVDVSRRRISESHVPRERLHGVDRTHRRHAFSVGDVVKAGLKHGQYTGRIIATTQVPRSRQVRNGHPEKHVPPRASTRSPARRQGRLRPRRPRARQLAGLVRRPPARRALSDPPPASPPPTPVPFPSQRHVVPRADLLSQHRRGHLQRPVRRRRARGARARPLAAAGGGGGDQGGERAAAVRVHALLVWRQERRRDARRARGSPAPRATGRCRGECAAWSVTARVSAAG